MFDIKLIPPSSLLAQKQNTSKNTVLWKLYTVILWFDLQNKFHILTILYIFSLSLLRVLSEMAFDGLTLSDSCWWLLLQQ